MGKALEWFFKALNYLKNNHLEEHPELGVLNGNIGAVFVRMGKPAEAIEWLQMAEAVFEKYPNFRKGEVGTLLSLKAYLLFDLDKHAEAFECLNKAISNIEGSPNSDPIELGMTYATMAKWYWELGKYDNACKWIAKALRRQRKTLGKQHPYTMKIYILAARFYVAWKKFSKAFIWMKKIQVLHGQFPNTKYNATDLKEIEEVHSMLALISQAVIHGEECGRQWSSEADGENKRQFLVIISELKMKEKESGFIPFASLVSNPALNEFIRMQLEGITPFSKIQDDYGALNKGDLEKLIPWYMGWINGAMQCCASPGNGGDTVSD